MRGSAQAIGTIAPLLVLVSQGASAFGLLSVLTAVAGLSVIFEWGQPLKLQNAISRGDAGGGHGLRWFLVESGFVPLALLNAVAAWVLWRFSAAWIPRVFPVDVAQAVSQQSGALLAIFLVAAATGATYHGRSVVFGLGHIDTGFAFGLLAALITLAGVALGLALRAPTVLVAVLVAAMPLLERLIACVYCFGRSGALPRHPTMPPPLTDDRSARSGRSVAPMFLYLQLLALVASNLDSVYAARANSLQSVGEYAFLLKLYGIPLLIVNILASASMPRLAVEARGRGDGGRATIRALLRSNVVVVAVVGGTIVLGGGLLYERMTGAAANLRPLAGLMLIDACLLAMRGVLTTYVNAAEELWLNVAGNTLFAVAAIGLKIRLVDGFGVHGLVVANIVAFVVFLLPFQWLALARAMRRA